MGERAGVLQAIYLEIWWLQVERDTHQFAITLFNRLDNSSSLLDGRDCGRSSQHRRDTPSAVVWGGAQNSR